MVERNVATLIYMLQSEGMTLGLGHGAWEKGISCWLQQVQD